MIVVKIPRSHTIEWIRKKHYAHTVPSISHSFGLYENNILIGIVTYGNPPSTNLRNGIAGEQWASIVIELNRLVINNNSPKNSASFLVGNSIKLLPSPSIIVSYADTKQGHTGYVYQATNFLYTGLSAKRTNWIIEGEKNKHSFTIADMSRGKENRVQYMRDTFGDKFKLEERSRKHRYIFIHASKSKRKEILKSIMYPIEPYPKGDNKNYNADYEPNTQMIMF